MIHDKACMQWGTLSGDTAPEISEDGMSAIVSATLSMSLEVTEGSTSTQEFLDGTIRCNHDLLATDLEPEAPREEDTCQSADVLLPLLPCMHERIARR